MFTQSLSALRCFGVALRPRANRRSPLVRVALLPCLLAGGGLASAAVLPAVPRLLGIAPFAAPSKPVITGITPGTITQLTTSITVTGSGFLPGSMICVNGTPLPTIAAGSSKLTATLSLATAANTTLQITVSAPNAGISNGMNLPANFAKIAIQPATLIPGPVTLSVSGSNFTSGSKVLVNGVAVPTRVTSPSSITATTFLPPWQTGAVTVQLNGSNGQALATQTLPMAPTAVTYEAAARFTTQAAFGPRPDLVQHIQQIGFDAFLTEQLKLAPIVFPQDAPRAYIVSAFQGTSLVRQRVALALQGFLVPHQQDFFPSSTVYEDKLEADVTGNYRQILSDVVSDANVATFLTLEGNAASANPLIQPNQNFARELLQLFSIGTIMLNDDGSPKLDATNNHIPAYGQDTVIALTRALTGWYYPPPQNPATTAWNIDFALPLAAYEPNHDHGAKTLFGTTTLPAGNTAAADRTTALDAIFAHPNLPPFVSRLLIQHLVTSNPSPAYIQRVAHVFENNGSNVRGDMTAVLRAILLDAEARKGDTTPSPSDGFLQDPLLFQLFAMNITGNPGTDDQGNYIAGALGMPWWNSPTIFGAVSPSYTIPGTGITSPEFLLFNNLSLTTRSEVLWGIVFSQQPGYTMDYTGQSWLLNNFTTVPAMVDALNHLVYHGKMSAQEQSAITNYCAQLPRDNNKTALKSAIFLALNADSYNVAQ